MIMPFQGFSIAGCGLGPEVRVQDLCFRGPFKSRDPGSDPKSDPDSSSLHSEFIPLVGFSVGGQEALQAATAATTASSGNG